MPENWFANKGQIIQMAVAVMALILGAIREWPTLKDNEFLSAGALLFYALVGLVVISIARLVSSLRRSVRLATEDPYSDPGTLGLRILREDFSYLLEQYRRLDFDYRGAVGGGIRFPRSKPSWPSFGKEWQHVHARLYSLNEMAEWTLTKARRVWNDKQWAEESRLFRSDDKIVMVDLLVGLEECINQLERNIEKHASRG